MAILFLAIVFRHAWGYFSIISTYSIDSIGNEKGRRLHQFRHPGYTMTRGQADLRQYGSTPFIVSLMRGERLVPVRRFTRDQKNPGTTAGIFCKQRGQRCLADPTPHPGQQSECRSKQNCRGRNRYDLDGERRFGGREVTATARRTVCTDALSIEGIHACETGCLPIEVPTDRAVGKRLRRNVRDFPGVQLSQHIDHAQGPVSRKDIQPSDYCRSARDGDGKQADRIWRNGVRAGDHQRGSAIGMAVAAILRRRDAAIAPRERGGRKE